MSDWLPEDPIAMERRHILESEKRVARKEALVRELTRYGPRGLAPKSAELLGLLRKSLPLARRHPRTLEQDRLCKPSNSI